MIIARIYNPIILIIMPDKQLSHLQGDMFLLNVSPHDIVHHILISIPLSRL
jgi:hypothetical protein